MILQQRPNGALSSQATARNTGPILEVLSRHLPPEARVLEVASGAGEHAVAAVAAFPGAHWTPSDPSAEARISIASWTERHALQDRIAPPLALDCLAPETWPEASYDAVVAINMVHISPWAATLGLVELARTRLVRPGGRLILYGPYREDDVPLAVSNRAFDDNLKARNPEWGLRDRQAVVDVCATAGLDLLDRVTMPANNLMLIFAIKPGQD